MCSHTNLTKIGHTLFGIPTIWKKKVRFESQLEAENSFIVFSPLSSKPS